MQNHERPIHVLTEIDSAGLIARLAHGLLTGPAAVAFLRQTALNNGAELLTDQLMNVAESLAQESIRRGFNLSSLSYRLASKESQKRAQEAVAAQSAIGGLNVAE